MIVFINGTFGVGKTTAAERLVVRLPGSLLFDAELVGSLLRRIVAPIENPARSRRVTAASAAAARQASPRSTSSTRSRSASVL